MPSAIQTSQTSSVFSGVWRRVLTSASATRNSQNGVSQLVPGPSPQPMRFWPTCNRGATQSARPSSSVSLANSKPSLRPSPSVSALLGSVPASLSSESVRPSPSASGAVGSENTKYSPSTVTGLPFSSNAITGSTCQPPTISSRSVSPSSSESKVPSSLPKSSSDRS